MTEATAPHCANALERVPGRPLGSPRLVPNDRQQESPTSRHIAIWLASVSGVVGFTAAQIPNIAERRYPPELAGSLYPRGIPR